MMPLAVASYLAVFFFFFMSKKIKCVQFHSVALWLAALKHRIALRVNAVNSLASVYMSLGTILKQFVVCKSKVSSKTMQYPIKTWKMFWLVTAVIFEYSGTEIHPTSFSNKETLTYKTTEKRLWLVSAKMCFISNQLPAEMIKYHQGRFIKQTIKRNDSLKTARIGFWTTALHTVNLIIFSCCLEAIVVGRFSIRSSTQLKHAHVGVAQK